MTGYMTEKGSYWVTVLAMLILGSGTKLVIEIVGTTTLMWRLWSYPSFSFPGYLFGVDWARGLSQSEAGPDYKD